MKLLPMGPAGLRRSRGSGVQLSRVGAIVIGFLVLMVLFMLVVGPALDKTPMKPDALSTLNECERQHLVLFTDLASAGELGEPLRDARFSITHKDVSEVVERCASLRTARVNDPLMRDAQDQHVRRTGMPVVPPPPDLNPNSPPSPVRPPARREPFLQSTANGAAPLADGR